MDIIAHNLSKQYNIYKKPPGLVNSLRALFHREYEQKFAVRPLQMTIDSGEIVGLLGPNGAGKTTIMKMMSGIIVPSAGELRVLGFTPSQRSKEFRRKIALVMGQKSQLWWDIPAMDSFQLLQAYYQIPDREFKTRVGELAELLEVQQLLHVHVRKLSLGERMKMELMACLLHRPQILFLDEPTIGLDIVAQKRVREFLKDYLTQYRTTIILTSHYMADVEALCSRLILLIGGEKDFDGPISEFELMLGREKNVSFTFSSSLFPQDIKHEFWQRFDPQWNSEGTQVDLRVPLDEVREISREILHRFPVIDFSTEKMPIERVLKTLITTKGKGKVPLS